jgi:hypothetical protein
MMIVYRSVFILLLILFSVTPLILAEEAPPPFPATVYLIDGTVLNGVVIETADDSIVIETSVGIITIPRDKIHQITRDEIRGEGTATNDGDAAISKSKPVKPGLDSGGNPLNGMGNMNAHLEENKIKLYFMLHEKEFKDKLGIYEMQRISGEVPLADRLTMYTAFEKKDQGLGTGLNIFIPGLGSWMQGDVYGALIQNGLLLAGTTLILLNDSVDYQNSSFYNEGQGQSDMLLYTGIGIIAVDWIYGIIRPFIYVKRYNKRIAASLRISVTALDRGYRPGPHRPYNNFESNRRTDRHLKIDLLSIQY